MLLDPDDLDVFLDGEDFAEEATFHLGTEAEPNDRTVLGIFDDEFASRSQGDGIILDTTGPILTCKTSELAGVERETLVTLRGELYSVVRLMPDGTGMTKVVLAHDDGMPEVDE